VGGYRNDPGRRATLDSVGYGDDHFTCFEFHYDWRRDNSENAVKLSEFIKDKAVYVREVRRTRFGIKGEPVRFDIVAHSMGGLITRYFLRYGDQPLNSAGSLPELNWAGARDVETVILVGTPNAGSADGLQSLVDGVKYSPVLHKYPAAVLGTMPSVYQLLPRTRHGIVVNARSGQPIDLYDWKQWQQFGWGLLDPEEDDHVKKLLPNATTRSERYHIAADHLRKSLVQARRFQHALDIPAAPPAGTSIYLIAGDAKDTVSRIEVNPQNGKLKVAAYAAGDETVLRSSAMMDERLDQQVPWSPRLISPIAWRHTTFLFTDHLGLTSDPAFTDNVLYLLLESPR
jgi:pimeloyl-ACP methyl ester carboxylesterase